MTKQTRVEIVEDDRLVALDLEKTLVDVGYTVSGIFDSGEEFLAKVSQDRPDVVLMDISLSGSLDGIETAKRLGELVGTPVVFITASTDEGTLQRAKLTLPFGYLIKPFDAHEIRSVIELTTFRAQDGVGTEESVEAEFSYQGVASDEEVADAQGRAMAVFSRIVHFSKVGKETLENLASTAQLRSFAAGELLLTEGAEAEFAFIVVSGRLSVMKAAETGRELIVSLLAPGDSYGLLFSFKEMCDCASVRAQINSKVLVVRSDVLRKLVELDAGLSCAITSIALARLANANQLCINLAHSRVEDRILSAIVHLLPQFGKPVGDSGETSRIYITRKELADLTGTTPETAIRVTKNLEREGLLDLTRPGIIKVVNLPEFRERVVN